MTDERWPELPGDPRDWYNVWARSFGPLMMSWAWVTSQGGATSHSPEIVATCRRCEWRLENETTVAAVVKAHKAHKCQPRH